MKQLLIGLAIVIVICILIFLAFSFWYDKAEGDMRHAMLIALIWVLFFLVVFVIYTWLSATNYRFFANLPI